MRKISPILLKRCILQKKKRQKKPQTKQKKKKTNKQKPNNKTNKESRIYLFIDKEPLGFMQRPEPHPSSLLVGKGSGCIWMYHPSGSHRPTVFFHYKPCLREKSRIMWTPSLCTACLIWIKIHSVIAVTWRAQNTFRLLWNFHSKRLKEKPSSVTAGKRHTGSKIFLACVRLKNTL